MTKSLLCVGECMVELAPTADGTYVRGFAGDTFNTAWYARRLLPGEWTVGFGSCVGEDAVSGQMVDFIAEQGIDTQTIHRLTDRTVGLYMISLQGGERSFSYWRGQSAAKALARDPARLAGMLQGHGMLHFSAITLAILPEADREVFCDAVQAARQAGALVSFDTNLRPRLWESPDAMRAGVMAGAAVADIVLPSFDEETSLWGDHSPQNTVTRYADAGAGRVVVKDGGGPVTLWSTHVGVRQHPVAPVGNIIDTTAAGDSFAGAFLAHLARGATDDSAALAAASVAGRVIQARGALVPGACDAKDAA
jgi:2-dehydro-3-deoxygluconokinase